MDKILRAWESLRDESPDVPPGLFLTEACGVEVAALVTKLKHTLDRTTWTDYSADLWAILRSRG